jgi:large subunit ribosomal protein L15
MKYNELQMDRQKKAKRVGRGISAGGGKTAGRGTKGQGSRKSGGVRAGFEGGQMPLYMRLPKLRGFQSKRPASQIIYTGQLESVNKTIIDNQTLAEAGLVAHSHGSVKLLLNGEIKSKKTVKLQAASAQAKAAVEKAGGSFETVERLPRPKVKKTKDQAQEE